VVKKINKYVFKKNDIPDPMIFRIPESTEELKTRVVSFTVSLIESFMFLYSMGE